MTHRPYPNPARARHQIERHVDETPPLSDGSGRPLTPFEQHFMVNMQAVGESLRPTLVNISESLRAAFQPRPVSSEETST